MLVTDCFCDFGYPFREDFESTGLDLNQVRKDRRHSKM